MIVSPIYSSKNMRASPGIEPGPLAPETSILPLNYEASPNICFLLYFLLFYYFLFLIFLEKKYKGTIGFEPMTAGTAVLRSTTELCALLFSLTFLSSRHVPCPFSRRLKKNASRGSRTHDLTVKSRTLYRLS